MTADQVRYRIVREPNERIMKTVQSWDPAFRYWSYEESCFTAWGARRLVRKLQQIRDQGITEQVLWEEKAE